MVGLNSGAQKIDEQVTHFVMVRHGQTEWNAAGRWQGWLDSPLTELGRAQAAEAGKRLEGYRFDAAYSSDAQRALETARIILKGRNVAVEPAEALRERFYGDYEGLNSAEIEVRFPGSRYEAGRDTRDDWRPPKGETLIEVKERVLAFLGLVAARQAGKTVLLVSHSGVLRVCDSLASGQMLETMWDRQPGNGAILEFDGTPSGQLTIRKHFFGSAPA